VAECTERRRIRVPRVLPAVPASERLRGLLNEEFGTRAEVREKPEGGTEFCIQIGDGAAGDMPQVPSSEEGYALKVDPSGAWLGANNATGLLWAAMTFRQLVHKSEDGIAARCCTISDWPRYCWRAFMIDSGRSPNSLPKIRRIIRICSAFKLNAMVFREGDDEMNAVRYRTNPLGSENPHAFTMEQVEEMVRYAASFGISVVPEVESLGHSSAKGRHFPDLVSGGFEQDYGFLTHTRKSHLAPGDPRSYALLRSIYEEWLPLLPEPMIHLGLDEVRLPAEDQARHLEGLLALLDDISEAHGREVTPVVWADAPPTPPRWRRRVVRCPWNYGDGEPNGPENAHLQKQQVPELLGGASDQPVIMAGGSGSLHAPNTKSGFREAVANLLSWAQWGESADNAVGLLSVQWSGNATDDWLPDFLTAADFGWQVPEGDVSVEEQSARVHMHLARLKDAAAPSPDEVDRPCWDGIWLRHSDQLRDGDWDEDIVTGRRKT